MHGGFSRWFAATLTAATISVSGTYVCGQDVQPWQPSPEPGYAVPQPTEYMASTTSLNADGAVDLNRRVAELERALKAMDDKAAADKKKAAGKFTAIPGGRIQLDTATFDQNAASKAQVGDVQNGIEFRRARMFVAGEGFDVMDYLIEMDFASLTRPAFKDVYFTIKELPYLQNLRIGHFKEPFGLEEMTSDSSTTFMERSLSDDGAIIPGRNVGAMAFGYTEDLLTSWAGGAFVSQMGEDPPIYQNDDPSYAWTMRATRLLWYDDASEGRGLFHTGLDYSFRSYADNVPRVWRSRPEAHLAPYLVNLSLPIDNEQLVGAEAAFLYGPFSIQAEWFGDFINGQGAQPNHTFQGGYVYVSYFLTGEHRPYDRKKGVFSRMRPFTNFFRVRTLDGDVATGPGAWEIGYRCSYFDALDSSLMHTTGAGEILDHTFGVNWYLNPYTRFMFNYVISDADRVTGGNLIRDGQLNTLEMRAQIDF